MLNSVHHSFKGNTTLYSNFTASKVVIVRKIRIRPPLPSFPLVLAVVYPPARDRTSKSEGGAVREQFHTRAVALAAAAFTLEPHAIRLSCHLLNSSVCLSVCVCVCVRSQICLDARVRSHQDLFVPSAESSLRCFYCISSE